MKKKLIFIIAAIIAVLCLIIFVEDSSAKPKITIEQINKNLSNGALLIDVRTPSEYVTQHAKDAINLPLTDIQNNKLPKVGKNTSIYVYCRSGVRAGKAKTILENAGYTNITSLGGLDDWVALGGQVASN